MPRSNATPGPPGILAVVGRFRQQYEAVGRSAPASNFPWHLWLLPNLNISTLLLGIPASITTGLLATRLHSTSIFSDWHEFQVLIVLMFGRQRQHGLTDFLYQRMKDYCIGVISYNINSPQPPPGAVAR